MSNALLKKVTAGAAALSIVLTMILPVSGVKAASAAVEAANNLAGNDIIKDQSNNPANYKLNSTITRKEMLKVMINLAGDVEVENSCKGVFSDMKRNDWGCKYAETAVDAGFIAKKKKFRPNDAVTEAEALKMVMQALNLEKAEGITQWQKAYKEAAAQYGIIGERQSVSAKGAAKRSFVFLVADAAMSIDNSDTSKPTDNIDDEISKVIQGDDKDTNEDGKTPEFNGDKTSNVTGGNVEISLNPDSIKDGTDIVKNGRTVVAKVDFAAGDKDISVKTVQVEKLGLSEIPSGAKVRVGFEKNGKKVGNFATISKSDNTANITFNSDFVIKAKTVLTLDFVVDLTNMEQNSTLQFTGKITDSSADNNQGSFTTNSVRTANYSAVTVEFSKLGSDATYDQDDTLVTLGQFKLASRADGSLNKDATVDRISLRLSGTGDAKNIEDLQLMRNGQKVSTEVTSDGKFVDFYLKDELKSGANANYYIKGKVVRIDNETDTYQFALKKEEDMTATEVRTGARATITKGNDATLANYTVKGAKVRFQRDATLALSKDFAKGTQDAVILKGTVNAKDSITLEKLTLPYTYKLYDTSGNSNSGKVDSLVKKITARIGGQNVNGDFVDGNKVVFDGTWTINGLKDVEVAVDFDNSQAGTFKLETLSLNSFDSAEYESNSEKVGSAAGNIAGVNATVKDTRINISRTDGLGNTTLVRGTRDIVLYQIKVTPTMGNTVTFSNPKFKFETLSSTGLSNGDLTLNLRDGNDIIDTRDYTTGDTVTFDGLNKTLNQKDSMTLTVTADVNEQIRDGVRFKLKLASLDANDDQTANIITINDASTPSSVEFTVGNSSVDPIYIGNENKPKLFVKESRNNTIGALRLKAVGDDLNLTELVLEAVDGNPNDAFSSYRIEGISQEAYIDGKFVRFEDLSQDDGTLIKSGNQKSFVVKADAVSVNDSQKIRFKVVSVKTRNSNGSENNVDLGNVYMGGDNSGEGHLVSRYGIIASKESAGSTSANNPILKFKVNVPNDSDDIKINQLKFNIDLGNFNTDGKRLVVRDSSGTNITGDVDWNGNEVTLSNTNYNITQGTNEVLTVEVEGIYGVNNSNTSWTVKLNDIVFSGQGSYTTNISGRDYDNVGISKDDIKESK